MWVCVGGGGVDERKDGRIHGRTRLGLRRSTLISITYYSNLAETNGRGGGAERRDIGDGTNVEGGRFGFCEDGSRVFVFSFPFLFILHTYPLRRSGE